MDIKEVKNPSNDLEGYIEWVLDKKDSEHYSFSNDTIATLIEDSVKQYQIETYIDEQTNLGIENSKRD